MKNTPKTAAVSQPLGSIDEILAKHAGDWPACIAELRVVESATRKRGQDAALVVELCEKSLLGIRAQIALLERLPAGKDA